MILGLLFIVTVPVVLMALWSSLVLGLFFLVSVQVSMSNLEIANAVRAGAPVTQAIEDSSFRGAQLPALCLSTPSKDVSGYNWEIVDIDGLNYVEASCQFGLSDLLPVFEFPNGGLVKRRHYLEEAG